MPRRESTLPPRSIAVSLGQKYARRPRVVSRWFLHERSTSRSPPRCVSCTHSCVAAIRLSCACTFVLGVDWITGRDVFLVTAATGVVVVEGTPFLARDAIADERE